MVVGKRTDWNPSTRGRVRRCRDEVDGGGADTKTSGQKSSCTITGRQIRSEGAAKGTSTKMKCKEERGAGKWASSMESKRFNKFQPS